MILNEFIKIILVSDDDQGSKAHKVIPAFLIPSLWNNYASQSSQAISSTCNLQILIPKPQNFGFLNQSVSLPEKPHPLDPILLQIKMFFIRFICFSSVFGSSPHNINQKQALTSKFLHCQTYFSSFYQAFPELLPRNSQGLASAEYYCAGLILTQNDLQPRIHKEPIQDFVLNESLSSLPLF